MTKENVCLECGEDTATHQDRREPPIDVGLCLCLDCARNAAEERRDELADEIASINDFLAIEQQEIDRKRIQ